MLCLKDQEEDLTRILRTISKFKLPQTFKSLPQMNNQENVAELHKILQALVKTRKEVPRVEGLKRESKELITESNEVHNELLKFFKDKYRSEGGKSS